MFTVPSGGDGLYYFSTYLLVYGGEYGVFNIVVNDVIVCTAYRDSDTGSEWAQSTCSAVMEVAEGKELFTFLEIHRKQKLFAAA